MTAIFYLGIHAPGWLETVEGPLFCSRRRLDQRRRLPRARTRWALDSGGFTELAQHGEWRTGPEQYAAEIRRYIDEIGSLDWAAPQDWMCEPSMLARTGLTVVEHQQRTVKNFLRLRDLDPELPVVPVVQGWTLDEYLACVDLYHQHDIDLTVHPRVGVGSICRRSQSAQIETIIRRLTAEGVRCHAFGVRGRSFQRLAGVLASADSMAWSFNARYDPGPLPGCSHKRCSECPRYARLWRTRLLSGVHPELPFT